MHYKYFTTKHLPLSLLAKYCSYNQTATFLKPKLIRSAYQLSNLNQGHFARHVPIKLTDPPLGAGPLAHANAPLPRSPYQAMGRTSVLAGEPRISTRVVASLLHKGAWIWKQGRYVPTLQRLTAGTLRETLDCCNAGLRNLLQGQNLHCHIFRGPWKGEKDAWGLVIYMGPGVHKSRFIMHGRAYKIWRG